MKPINKRWTFFRAVMLSWQTMVYCVLVVLGTTTFWYTGYIPGWWVPIIVLASFALLAAEVIIRYGLLAMIYREIK